MTAILCKSDALGKELARLSGSETPCLCGMDQIASSGEWLRNCLDKKKISTVFYEASFFVDPAPFRELSPDTKFVLVFSQDEQSKARQALACGACAVLAKPFTEQDVCGVLSLVSN
jgi:hypothetical protein